MGRGSDRLHTFWLPLHHIDLETGGVVLVEGSSSRPGFARLRETFGMQEQLVTLGQDPAELTAVRPLAPLPPSPFLLPVSCSDTPLVWSADGSGGALGDLRVRAWRPCGVRDAHSSRRRDQLHRHGPSLHRQPLPGANPPPSDLCKSEERILSASRWPTRTTRGSRCTATARRRPSRARSSSRSRPRRTGRSGRRTSRSSRAWRRPRRRGGWRPRRWRCGPTRPTRRRRSSERGLRI